ncbi:hypothetical protein EIP91_010291 [Steccherinum ochraceum]|uniref:Uncharacterized protein n=1 Tax=Steccherinum ochraceum TaxID=92696 RepID=A0A4R0RM19_9APHY|nr:hypothetical protein EIP91_010291 [Steccherinum ochraceum]
MFSVVNELRLSRMMLSGSPRERLNPPGSHPHTRTLVHSLVLFGNDGIPDVFDQLTNGILDVVDVHNVTRMELGYGYDMRQHYTTLLNLAGPSLKHLKVQVDTDSMRSYTRPELTYDLSHFTELESLSFVFLLSSGGEIEHQAFDMLSTLSLTSSHSSVIIQIHCRYEFSMELVPDHNLLRITLDPAPWQRLGSLLRRISSLRRVIFVFFQLAQEIVAVPKLVEERLHDALALPPACTLELQSELETE